MRKEKTGDQVSRVRNIPRISQRASPITSKESRMDHFQVVAKESNPILKLQKANLSDYFLNLHDHINTDHIITVKRHTELEAGLYILMEGKICYVSANLHDHEKKHYLFSIAKSGIFSMPANECISQGHSAQPQSFVLEKSFTVFQCQHENCLTLEDSIFIRVDSQQRTLTCFDDLLNQRISLLSNCHMNGLTNDSEALFSASSKISSCFRRHKFYFHNSIQLPSIAIIQSGVIQPRNSQSRQKKPYYQMHMYAILIPGEVYQVMSTEASVLAIQDNPTLCFKHPELILAHQLTKISKGRPIMFKQGQRHKSSCNSLHLRGEIIKPKVQQKWKINKRNKNLAQISRKYQDQLIISMHTCQQSLSFSEKQTRRLKQAGDKSKPNILFDYSKYSSSKLSQTFEACLEARGNSLQKCQNLKKRRPRKTIKENMVERYQNISKDLYLKFKAKRPNSRGFGDFSLEIKESI